MGFLALILMAAVAGWLVYRYKSQGTLDILKTDRDRADSTPEDILQRRLAEGVIDRKEFTRIRRTLRS